LLNSISSCFRDIGLYAYLTRLTRSRDVIGHMTVQFPIGHLLLVDENDAIKWPVCLCVTRQDRSKPFLAYFYNYKLIKLHIHS